MYALPTDTHAHTHTHTQRVKKNLGDYDGVFLRHGHGIGQEAAQILLRAHHLHGRPTQNIRRPHQDGVADLRTKKQKVEENKNLLRQKKNQAYRKVKDTSGCTHAKPS